MSTPQAAKSLSHAEIGREILRRHPESGVSFNMVSQVRRNAATSARVSALIAEAVASLEAKATRAAKRKPKTVTA